jgi:hypothetical protein
MKIFFLISFQLLTIAILLFVLNYVIHKKLSVCEEWKSILRGFSIAVFISLAILCFVCNIIDNYPFHQHILTDKELQYRENIFHDCLINSKDTAYECKRNAKDIVN